ncbi:MAG: HlyD family efflux transporter periplasmic adaptor subunit [Rhodospirillales bacterium]|jgi:HlyD family secretion protein|nr:HlyD family efflux transporter periplasmic adaptor subunit [Rhodospirillales bacterium]
MRKFAVLVVLVGIGIGFIAFNAFNPDENGRPVYRLAEIERGALVSSVSSSGTLSAVVTVQVGTQISGQISELSVDFNDRVSKGQVIARIDSRSPEAHVIQAEAELAIAEANVSVQRAAVERARASVQNARAELVAAEARTESARVGVENTARDLERKQSLRKRGTIAQSMLDTTETAYEQAVAQFDAAQATQRAQSSLITSRAAEIKMAEAEVVNVLAQVEQKKATLTQRRLDLDHTFIRSPVEGVVIDRAVDLGQTVAASLQAPTLFTIAQNLRDMQVEVSVDEADIGRIEVGQRVIFGVDSFPEKKFEGQVKQIRLSPTATQNVVTYTVVVSTANPNRMLLPGMTANVQVMIEERENVLKVANAALRFNPDGAKATASDTTAGGGRGKRDPAETIAKLTDTLKLNEDQQTRILAILNAGKEAAGKMREQGLERDEMKARVKQLRARNRESIKAVLTPEQRAKYERKAATRAQKTVQKGKIWVLGEDGSPQPVNIEYGVSDGGHTEILRGGITSGQSVIVGVNRLANKDGGGGFRMFGLGR